MSTSANPSARPRLTVATIVRDAESQIAATLQSVQAIADEIVVVDTGSTDSTRQVAAHLATRVVDWSWTDDFSAARNVALSHATGDWVLWLDAGETMTADDARRLREFLDQQADTTAIYMLLVTLPPEEGNVAGEQVGRFRLMPRREELSYVGRIRESIVPKAVEAGLRLEAVDMRIARSARDLDPAVRRAKAERDIRIAHTEIGERPDAPQPRLAKGEALMNLGSAVAARVCFQDARRVAQAGSGDMLEAYYGELTTYSDRDAAEREQQTMLCIEALEQFPLDTQLLCAMGGYLQASGRVDLAHRAYETAHLHGQVRPEIWHLGDVADVALVCLSLTLQLQNEDAQARQMLEHALAAGRTNSDRVRRQLIEVCIKLCDRPAALAEVEKLLSVEQGREAFRTAVRGACLAVQGNWISAKAYLETALQAGCRERLCFRWLAKSLIAMHETAEALEVLDGWRESEPHNPEIEVLRRSVAGDPQPMPATPTEAESPAAAAESKRRVDQPTPDLALHQPHQAPVSQPDLTPPGA
ncbi:MAG: glycosyltransferase [Planctomycetota bacterium]|nr:MAG: glycosyltransferase [Planctomycetota bacterium]REK49109.1 MAG: glycosyltransferase [Planctomycetota bacterium]